MMEIQKRAILAVLLMSLSLPAWGAPAAELTSFRQLLDCAEKAQVRDETTRAVFLACASPLFAQAVPRAMADRFALFAATRPNVDAVRLCSPKEKVLSGDRYHSDAIGCFQILEGTRVKSGYVFLKKENQKWLILDIKY